MRVDNRGKGMDKKGILLGIVLVLSSIYLCGCTEEKPNGDQESDLWQVAFDGAGYHDGARAAAIDFDGNIYVVGHVTNLSGSTSMDWWIKKLDSDGNQDTVNWNTTFGRKNLTEQAMAVATDEFNNIYVVGYGINLVGSTGYDWWIKKFDSNGNEDLVNWNKTIDGNASLDQALSVATDTSGNVYVSGLLWEANDTYSWIKKFDAQGNEDLVNWNKTIPSAVVFQAINTDLQDDVYFVGTNLDQNSSLYGSVIKFNAYGEHLWEHRYYLQESLLFSPTAVAVDLNGNVYVPGLRRRYGDENIDWWIKKFDSNGIEDIVNWNKIFDGNGEMDLPFSVAIDTSGNVYVVGYGTDLFGATGSDWWIKKFAANGNQQWDKRFDGVGGNDIAYSVVTDHEGYAYVVGVGQFLGGLTDSDWWIKKLI